MEHNGFTIRLNKAYTMYSVHQIGKGALPAVLSGLFTTPMVAKQAIDLYVSAKVPSKE